MNSYELKPAYPLCTFRVTITADMNDGDYLTNIETYTRDYFDEVIASEVQELNKIVGKNGALAELENRRYEDGEEGNLNIPFDTMTGEPCHTLESISVEFIDGDHRLYTVHFSEEEVK
ncbi:hypothetical protein 278BB001_70 [Bacillus phage 278BB001]|nr:hypothetical protein 278BB001_70 [Bacillus phage 278BB001]